MLQNARVTAFTVSELLRENQEGWGGGLPTFPPKQIKVKEGDKGKNNNLMSFIIDD